MSAIQKAASEIHSALAMLASHEGEVPRDACNAVTTLVAALEREEEVLRDVQWALRNQPELTREQIAEAIDNSGALAAGGVQPPPQTPPPDAPNIARSNMAGSRNLSPPPQTPEEAR